MRHHHDLRPVSRSRAAMLLAAVAAVPLAWPLPARAATDSFTNGSGGNWSTAGNWSLGHQPGNLDDVNLKAAGTLGSIVTYDAAAIATNLASLTLDAPSGRILTLSQSLGTLTTAAEIVGFTNAANL